jgi:myo-inositol-1(or 4)-monophosphatase
MSQPTPEQLQIFLDIATEAVMAAGTILEAYWGKLETVEEKGRPGDLVTAADKEAEAVILKILQRHFPEHSILAEESGQLGDNQSDYLWAIDRSCLCGSTRFWNTSGRSHL